MFFVKGTAAGTLPTNTERQLLAVPISTGATFKYGTPQPLFNAGPYGAFFDVDLNGKRFLMSNRVAGPESSARPSIVVVSHWFDEMQARMGR